MENKKWELTLTANMANNEVYALNVMNVMEIQALLMAMIHQFGSVDQHYYSATFVVDPNSMVP